MKAELLKLAYAQMYDYMSESGGGQREFDCLIFLIEEGTIDSFEELEKYGISKRPRRRLMSR